jgi:hypothetical protein
MSQLNGTGPAVAASPAAPGGLNTLLPTAGPYLQSAGGVGFGGAGMAGGAAMYYPYLNPTPLYSPAPPSYLPAAAASPDLQTAFQQQQQQQQQQQAQAQAQAVKRVAVEKSGVPVYQPAGAQPFPTVSQAQPGLHYTQLAAIPGGLGPTAYIPTVFTGHPPGMPRF